MLFVESKTLDHVLTGVRRIQLLEALEEENLLPLIRSARLDCFEHALLGPQQIADMEAAIASWTETENHEPYVPGDLFCLQDHAFFLIFDDNNPKGPVIRSGIVYSSSTTEPFRKLELFCRLVREMLIQQSEVRSGETMHQMDFPQWQHGKPTVPDGFKRFVAKQDTDVLYTSRRKEAMVERVRAASTLEDADARGLLRQAKEALAEGFATKLLSGERVGEYESSVGRLTDAGLICREVQVSCRKTGHALFRLPNSQALAVVTVSDATCSECGSPVADEKVEEVLAPTGLASSLLEDGSWLISRLHSVLREIGVPESEIAICPADHDGYGQMMANICGESFLLVARDGDLTPAFARWATDLDTEAKASHLVVVATGRIHNQAGVLLHTHARRRAKAGHDFELVLADDAVAAGRELQDAFELVSQRVISEQVCALDSGLGLSIGRLLITKFSLSRAADHPTQTQPITSAPDFAQSKPSLALAARASVNMAAALNLNDLVPHEPVPDVAAEVLEGDARVI